MEVPQGKKGPTGLVGKVPLHLGLMEVEKVMEEDGGNPAQTPSRCSAACVPTKFCMALPKR